MTCGCEISHTHRPQLRQETANPGARGLHRAVISATIARVNPPRVHSFNALVLEVDQPDLLGVAARQVFELRSAANGAEVWRCSELQGGELDDVRPEAMYVGRLSSRRVIELLTEIERSGIYEEALEDDGLDPTCARVSLTLKSVDGDARPVLEQAPADHELVSFVVKAIHRTVAIAQERSLAAAG